MRDEMFGACIRDGEEKCDNVFCQKTTWEAKLLIILRQGVKK